MSQEYHRQDKHLGIQCRGCNVIFKPLYDELYCADCHTVPDLMDDIKELEREELEEVIRLAIEKGAVYKEINIQVQALQDKKRNNK